MSCFRSSRTLFGRRLDVVSTRDVLVDHADGAWSSRPNPPPGAGWHLVDGLSYERRSLWVRIGPPDAPPPSAPGRPA